MKPLTLLLALLWLASCNPVKRVQRSESKTQQVVEHYLKTHPFKNDTITKVIPGDTIVTEKIDTVISHHRDTNSIYVDRVQTITRTVVKYITDTVEKVIDNRDFVRELQREGMNKDAEIAVQKKITEQVIKERDAAQDKARTRGWMFWGLIVAAGVYTGIKIFKPKISLT